MRKLSLVGLAMLVVLSFAAVTANAQVGVGVGVGPAVADPGALTTKWVAAPATTLTAAEVPVIEDVTVSVTVTVCEPAVAKVTA